MRDVRESIHRLRQRGAEYGLTKSNAAVGVLALVLITSGVAAYSSSTWTWEDGTLDGWSGGTVVQDGYYGSESLQVTGEDTSSNTINVSASEYSVRWTAKIDGVLNLNLDPGGQDPAYRVSVSTFTGNVLLYADGTGDSTTASGYASGGVWYDFWLRSNETATTLTIERSSDSTDSVTLSQTDVAPGSLSTIQFDLSGSTGTITMDNVSVSPYTQPPDEPQAGEEISIDSRDYIMPNETDTYSVYFTQNNETTEVTDSATVTSNNTSVLTVDSVEHLLIANESANTTVNVTAEYTASDGTVYNTTKQITVAEATVENLQILPTIWRFSATIGDDTMFFLIIAMLASVVGTRFTTAFGGISLYWVTVMIGWFAGWLSLGILLVTTVMSIFIGLNLAANIDYGSVGNIRR